MFFHKTDIEKAEHFFCSWKWTQPAFASILEELRSNPPDATPEAGLINVSSGKYVWHLNKSIDGQNYDFAYKTQHCSKHIRYLLQSSLSAREAKNYMHFAEIGIPTPKVLAVGDVRSFFFIKETFIATEFISDSHDGRIFMPNGAMSDDIDRKMEFSRRHLKCLAIAHDHNFFHKAFHPRNLLWRETSGDMEVFWIDVARCRKVPQWKMPKAILWDFYSFLLDMQLNREQAHSLMEHYLANRTCGFIPSSANEMMAKIERFKQHLFEKRRNLFS